MATSRGATEKATNRLRTVVRRALVTVLAFVFIGSHTGALAQKAQQGPPDFVISLKSRQFAPGPGLEKALQEQLESTSKEKLHALVQMDNIPDEQEKSSLREAGIELLAYIPDRAWFAAIPADASAIQRLLSRVRWFGSIARDDKIPPGIRARGVGPWAVNPDGTVNLRVTFFADSDAAESRTLVEAHGGTVLSDLWEFRELEVKIDRGRMGSLTNEDTVQWISEAPPPRKILNDDNRRNVRANKVQTLSLSGSGGRCGHLGRRGCR